MFVRAPLVDAEQYRSVRIEKLTEVGMGGSGFGLAEERLVPFETTRYVANANDRPGTFHNIFRAGIKPTLSYKFETA